MVERARVACLALVAVSLLAATPGTARAHDSLAPRNAGHNWLPHEEWVHRRWIPFDERALDVKLGLGPDELRAYLYNDHHTLADLARRRGVAPRALARQLVAPWRGISAKRRAVLLDRTWRILTQGHLSQHVFFHVFHGLPVHINSPDLFGMPDATYQALRQQGLSYAAVAVQGGVPLERLRATIVAMIESDHRDGIAARQAWPRRVQPDPRPHARTADVLAAATADQPRPGEPVRQEPVPSRAPPRRLAEHRPRMADRRAPRRTRPPAAAEELLAAPGSRWR